MKWISKGSYRQCFTFTPANPTSKIYNLALGRDRHRSCQFAPLQERKKELVQMKKVHWYQFAEVY